MAQSSTYNLKANCKPLYCILYGQRKDTWLKTRHSCSVLAGAVSGWLLCECFFKSLLIPKKYENNIILITIFITAIGFLFSDAVKCVALMIFLSLFGKSGRGYMRAITFAVVIAGPIDNLSSNAGEIVRTFTCSKVLAINLTRTRFDLMIKPLRETLIQIKDNIRDVQNTFNELKNVTEILHSEVMQEDVRPENINIDYNNIHNESQTTYSSQETEEELKAQQIEKRYKNKLKTRCLKQLENGKLRCRNAFLDALNKCYNKMPFILKSLICWPYKVDFVCEMNIFGNPEKICDPFYAVPDNFGANYIELLGAENKLCEKGSDIKVNYTILSSEEIPGIKKTEQIAENIANEFKSRKKMFDWILKLLQKLLGFMILKNVYGCVKYHKKYKEDIDHDNRYVTDYFKHLDRRRKLKNKQSLLPLKKYEEQNLFDEDHSWRRTPEESKAFTFYLLQLSLEIVTCCFFLFLDYVLLSVLFILRNNLKMDFVQDGEHAIQFQIQGSGLIARLLRNTMGNFNIRETVYTNLSNETCLPVPTILGKSFYFKLTAVYTFVLLIIYHNSRFSHMRQVVCRYFYRKREKKRILYLYNSLLKQRSAMKQIMIKQALYNFGNHQTRLKANLFLILRLKWPLHFNWLKKFSVGCLKCVICGQLEDSNFIFCRYKSCKVSYCNGCVYDIENNCLICNNLLYVEVILNFNDFFEQFSFA